MQHLKARADRAGSHYFSADTMRFFSSRILDVWQLDNDRYLFTSSERDTMTGAPRLYSVRLATFYRNDDGRERVDIGTAPGETFQGHDTADKARRAARAWIVADGA